MILCGKSKYLKNSHTSCFPALFSEGRSCPEPTELQGPTAEDLGSRKRIWDTDFHENSSMCCFRHKSSWKHSQQTCLLQEQGHRYQDGWWRSLVQAGGVCLEDKVLPVPSLNPEHLGQVRAWPSSDLS